MKVLFITNIPTPYRLDFFHELGKHCELTVSFEGDKSTERNDKWKGQFKNNYNVISLKGIRTSYDKFFCPSIIKLLNKNWDYIIVGVYSTPTSIMAMEYMKFKNIPFIVEWDGGYIKRDSSLKYRIKRHLIQLPYAWLSSGDATTDYLVHYGAQRNYCFKFPFTSLYKNDLKNAKNYLSKGKDYYREKLLIKEERIVLSVGRFSYDKGYGKGYDTLLKAAELLPENYGFYIVGDEPTAEFVEWKETKKLDNVHFVGFKTKNELAEYYSMADVFVLMTRGDVWGLVINEAMSFGLPIITTNMCNAGLELIDTMSNGFIIDSEDYDSLAKKITFLINDDTLMKKIKDNNIRKIETYCLEDMAERHIEIFKRLADRNLEHNR